MEPNQGNVRQWLDNLSSKMMPMEQCRWNQANIDTLFYAGNQSCINQNFSFSPGITAQSYYFNLVQQPVNMVTGYQRQHRKGWMYQPSQGSDPQTTDQYTKLITESAQLEGLHESFSKSCELAAVAGLNLLQPYLDFTGDDPAQGQLKLKIWEYNSFMVDPFFRQPDMSDCQIIWCQEYISKLEAEMRFADKVNAVAPMSGAPQRYGNFYFLPENHYMSRNDLFVLSYVWYKWKRKRKRLYSKKRKQFFDFAGGDPQLEQILYHIDDMQPVTVESPCWKVAVVLNDQLMFQGNNPYWEGPECPFIPNFWNYDPHINQQELRSRSLIFPMRSPQFLFNYKVINNNDIAAATINAGWKRKSGAVANEDNLKKAGQGWDVIVNEGYEMTDVEKIIPSAVPESDLALAQQMADLVFKTSGIDLENWSGQNEKQMSSLTLLIKQAANLLPFQKYFDQWDYCLKLVGEALLRIALNGWNEYKVEMLIGEKPSPLFYSRIFAKYKTVVAEGDLTVTQQNLQAQNMLDINQVFGREVFPPSMIVPKLNISGKGEIIPFLEQQEQQAQQVQHDQQQLQHVVEQAKLKELYSKAVANIATARERHGRAEADIGLFEERLSEITHNRAMAAKAKMEALEKMMDVIQRFGEVETMLQENKLESIEAGQEQNENREKADAKNTAESNKFLQEIMGNMHNDNNQEQQSQQPQEEMMGQQNM
jgi:hypothetical protein